MSKILSKYIASFDYFDKSLIVLFTASDGISIASFATVIKASVRIESVTFSFAFSITTGIVRKILKRTQNKKKKHNKIVMLARCKLNSLGNKISETLINNEISQEEFTTIINEEKIYRGLNESIRMMKSQRCDTEKDNLIEESKRKGIDEIITQNSISKSIKQCYHIV